MADTLRDAGENVSQPDDINEAIDELLDKPLIDNYAEEFAHVLDAIGTELVQEVSGGSGVDITGSTTNPTVSIDDDEIDAGVPEGVISMWSGSISDIPDGWTLCDGTDGAPDLTNRFVVGAGDEYSVDDTGGEKEVQLTEDEMPEHSHGYHDSGSGNSSARNSSAITSSGGHSGDSWSNSNIGDAGGGESHENRPPYYALAYIMKLGGA